MGLLLVCASSQTMTKVATSDVFTKWTHSVASLGTEGLICGRVVAARITLASSDDRISSSKDVKACKISVRMRNSVPYHCLTSFGKSA